MAVLIIAEAGVNHNGDIRLVKKMIEAAAAAGADIIKFQTFCPNSIVSKFAQKAEYQKRNTGSDESQLEMLRKLSLKNEDYPDIINCCKEHNIQFLSTPFDLESIDFLNTLGMPFWKIPSGEITNYPYLVAIAKTKMPIILSTGMSTVEEISDTINLLKANQCNSIKLLHCNTEYPTPMEDVNLKAMKTLWDEFGLSVGYSDHTQGIEVPVAAVALGAEIIEKHFTLDKNMQGPDHKASLEPSELKQMVDAIRNIEKAIGNGIKTPSISERKNIDIARKSIVAKINIYKGDTFTEANITTKRPGNGISPMKWNNIIGKAANRDFVEDELIEI